MHAIATEGVLPGRRCSISFIAGLRMKSEFVHCKVASFIYWLIDSEIATYSILLLQCRFERRVVMQEYGGTFQDGALKVWHLAPVEKKVRVRARLFGCTCRYPDINQSPPECHKS